MYTMVPRLGHGRKGIVQRCNVTIVALTLVMVSLVVTGQDPFPSTLTDNTPRSLTDQDSDEGPDGSVAGVSLGPEQSLLCSPPFDLDASSTAAMRVGSVGMSSRIRPPTTVCAFVRVNVTRKVSRLVTLQTSLFTLTIGTLVVLRRLVSCSVTGGVLCLILGVPGLAGRCDAWPQRHLVVEVTLLF